MYAFGIEGLLLLQDPEGECGLTSEHDRARNHGEDTDRTGEEGKSKAEGNSLLDPRGNEHGADQRHQSARHEASNRCIEAGQRSYDQQSSSLTSLQLTNPQPQLGFLKTGPFLNRIGQLMHPVDGPAVAIPCPKQQYARRVGQNRRGRDERQYCEWIRREIHFQDSLYLWLENQQPQR